VVLVYAGLTVLYNKPRFGDWRRTQGVVWGWGGVALPESRCRLSPQQLLSFLVDDH